LEILADEGSDRGLKMQSVESDQAPEKKALRLMEEALEILTEAGFDLPAAQLDLSVNQLRVDIEAKRHDG
jgi:hypothetical protein